MRHMAIHDPDSGIRAKNEALKMGRQKKVITDDFAYEGESDSMEANSEMIEEDLTENEEEEGVLEGEDGDQYVVLEVIQVPEEDDEEGDKTVEYEGK